MTVINNIIELLLTLAIVFVAPLMIAYAGFLYVVNPFDPSGISKAKGILTNTIIGIVIALAGWMIVDAVMAALYDPSVNAGKTWSSLIFSSGPVCLPQQGVGTGLNQTTAAPSVTTGGVPQVGVTHGLCATDNGACGVPAIQQAAQALNMSLNTSQATTMSCIAVTESGGIPNGPNSSSGACGTFQITTQPGNWSISGLHKSPCSTSSSCNLAACNLQTALLLYNQRGYQPWTGKNPNGTYWNANAVACAQKYDPGASL